MTWIPQQAYSDIDGHPRRSVTEIRSPAHAPLVIRWCASPFVVRRIRAGHGRLRNAGRLRRPRSRRCQRRSRTCLFDRNT